MDVDPSISMDAGLSRTHENIKHPSGDNSENMVFLLREQIADSKSTTISDLKKRGMDYYCLHIRFVGLRKTHEAIKRMKGINIGLANMLERCSTWSNNSCQLLLLPSVSQELGPWVNILRYAFLHVLARGSPLLGPFQNPSLIDLWLVWWSRRPNLSNLSSRNEHEILKQLLSCMDAQENTNFSKRMLVDVWRWKRKRVKTFCANKRDDRFQNRNEMVDTLRMVHEHTRRRIFSGDNDFEWVCGCTKR